MSKVYLLAAATALLSLTACNPPAERTPPEAPSAPAAKPAEPAAAPAAPAAEKPAAPAAKPTAEAKPKPATATQPAAAAPPAAEAKPAPPVAEPAKPAAPAAAPLGKDQAMALAAKGNCVACHKIEVRVVGPAWKDVAAKYRNDPNAAATIASHIKSGGSFGWKFGVMPPRGGSQLPDADVDSLAKFIAGLK